jgi:hypothetical protein
MSAINEAIEAVIGLMNETEPFAPVTRGALPTGIGLVCELGPSTPEAVYLDKNSYIPLDIALNGKTEMFQQSEKAPPYERTRPAADLFLKFDKNHSSIIKQLNDMLKDDTPVEPEDDFSSFRT